MTKASRTAADTRRRRASTGRMMDEIMELARSLPLTRQVLADSLEAATPAQMEFMLSWMNEELASRGGAVVDNGYTGFLSVIMVYDGRGGDPRFD